MERVFLEILNRGIAAGWLVLAVLVLRLIFRKAPKKFFVLLWGLVGLRLLLPFSLESSFSLVPSRETVPQEVLTAERPSIQSGISAVDEVINPVIGKALASDTAAAAMTGSTPARNLAAIAAIVWSAGAGTMLLYAFVSWLRIRRRVRPSVRLKGRVWACDYVDTPFILGIFQPRIYLPTTLSGEDRAAVIAHEEAHLTRRDHLWKPLGFLLLALFWFHPLLWAAYILLCRDIEYACDEKVLAQLGESGKKHYAETLLNVSVPRRMILASPLAFGETGVKSRIRSVLKYKKARAWIIAAAAVLLAAAAVCFLTNPRTKRIEIKKENVAWVEYREHQYGTFRVRREDKTAEVDALIDALNGECSYVKKDWAISHYGASGYGTDELIFYRADGIELEKISIISNGVTGFVVESAFLGDGMYKNEKGILSTDLVEACFDDGPWNVERDPKDKAQLTLLQYCWDLYRLAEQGNYVTVDPANYDRIQSYIVAKVIRARGQAAEQSDPPGIREISIDDLEIFEMQPETGDPQTVTADVTCRVWYENGDRVEKWYDRLQFKLEAGGKNYRVADVEPALRNDFLLIEKALQAEDGFDFDKVPAADDYETVDRLVESLLVNGERSPAETQKNLPYNDAKRLSEEYTAEILHSFEEGSMRTYEPWEFESINGYLTAKSIIDDRCTYANEHGEGIRELAVRAEMLSCKAQEDGSVLAEVEGTIHYSAEGSNHQITHRYLVKIAEVDGKWCCVDIDAQDDEKILRLKEKIAGMTYQGQIDYLDKALQSGEEAPDFNSMVKQKIFLYAGEIFDSVNGSSTAVYVPEKFETVNGYLAAKYYQTMREWYVEKGYPVQDHHLTGVILDNLFTLDRDGEKERLFAEVSIYCAYTEPGMGTPQHYIRKAELILEKTGGDQVRVVGFNSIGAADEIMRALRSEGMSIEDKYRYIDEHIKDAVVNDGLLPMDNK